VEATHICGSDARERLPCLSSPVGRVSSHSHRCYELIEAGLLAASVKVLQVVEADFLIISLVRNPVQKYSVGFLTDVNGQKVDQYNYSNVGFIAQRVVSPWHGWQAISTTCEVMAEEVAHIKTSVPCPCISGKDFGSCCAGKEKFVVPHLEIVFLVSPPSGLSNVELFC